MKRTRLLVTFIGLLVIAALASDAFGRNRMYNPATGTFMQRDPLGTLAQSPVARNFSSPQFTQRDPTEQYEDGMNLLEYVGSSPTNNTDPTGLVYDIQVKQLDITLTTSTTIKNGKVKTRLGPPINVGHTWISWPGDSIGFWPTTDGMGAQPGKVRRNDDLTEGAPDTIWETRLRQPSLFLWIIPATPIMTDGPKKGTPCCNVTKNDIIDCMKARGATIEKTKEWSLYGYNCRDFVEEVLRACCLEKQ
jgi:hypothetical protein